MKLMTQNVRSCQQQGQELARADMNIFEAMELIDASLKGFKEEVTKKLQE